jgi:hypothetical protein
VLRLCDRSSALLERDLDTDTARSQEIRDLRDDLARAAVTTASLPETVRVYVEASEGQTRVVHWTQVENDTVELVRQVIREVPVEGETRVVVLESREVEVRAKTRGCWFRPKAVLGSTTEKNVMPGLGARFAFFGDGGLAAVALWDGRDRGSLGGYVGAGVDWRLGGLAINNTAVGGALCMARKMQSGLPRALLACSAEDRATGIARTT